MDNIKDIRAKSPEFANLSDESVVNVLLRTEYPELTREQLAAEIGAALPRAPEKSRSWGQAAGDTGRALLAGGAGLVEGVGTLYGLAPGGNMDNPLRELGKSGREYWEEGQSDQLKAKKAVRSQAIDGTDDVLGKAGAALWETISDPALAADTVASNIATLIPGAAAGRIGAGVNAARGLAAASKFGPASLAARQAVGQAAGKVGVRTAVGVGAVQQGADVSGDVYDASMKKPDEVWANNSEFMQAFGATDGSEQAWQDTKHAFALSTARATMPAATGISLATNLLPGATMLERALVGGAARNTIGAGTKYAMAKAIGKGALGEAGQETIEEGGGAFAGNVAKQKFIDDRQDLGESVGENAGMGAAGGFLLGAGGGAFHSQAHAPAVDPAIAAAQAQAQREAQAREDAIAAARAAAQAPNSPLSRAAAAANPAPAPAGATPGAVPPGMPQGIASILDTDPVYEAWSNVRDGSDRQTMRDQMDYVGSNYAGKVNDANRAGMQAELATQFKWFRGASPEQQAAVMASLMAPAVLAAAPAAPAQALTPEQIETEIARLDAKPEVGPAEPLAPASATPSPAEALDPIEETQRLIDESLIQAADDKARQRAAAASAAPDLLYQQAADTVLKNRRASISLVQRELNIGYNRAARLVEDMEHAGLVSAMSADGTRTVLKPQADAAPAVQQPAPEQPQPQGISNEPQADQAIPQQPQAQASAPAAAMAGAAGEVASAPSNGVLDGDKLNASGKPFNLKGAAIAMLRKHPDHELVKLSSGWVIRPTPAADVSKNDEKFNTSVQPAQKTPESEQVITPAPSITNEEAPAYVPEPENAGMQESQAPVAQGAAQESAAPVAANQSITGPAIDKDWSAFTPESGTLSVPRAEMPQIKAEHRGAMVNFLKARGIESQADELPADSLKPTQAEFSPEKVAKAQGFTGPDRSILVSSDGYVLDGHHQWLAKREAGVPVKIIRLDAPIDALLSAVREFPSATLDEGSTPAAPAAAPAPAKTDAEQASEILTAAGLTGKERLEVLGQVKDGTFTPDELLAAYPPARAPAAAPAPGTKASESAKAPDAAYGAANTLVTLDQKAAILARMKAKLSPGRLNSGIDPELLADGIQLGVFHLEAGVRRFADFTKAIAADLGSPVADIKQYLRAWYNGARDMMEDSGRDVADMDDPDAVRAALKQMATDEQVQNEDPQAQDGEPGPRETLLGANNDNSRNDTDNAELLDEGVPQPGAEDTQTGADQSGDGLRTPDTQGNGNPDSGGAGRGNGLDGDTQPVLPGTPAEVRPLADGLAGKTEDRPAKLAGENPGNFVITDEFNLGAGTDAKKIEANMAAIRMLRTLQAEHRFPTSAEQAVMARYVGWGGLKTVFDPKKTGSTDRYGKAQAELKEMLSPAEYHAANDSIRNAHYTAQGVVDAMWRVVRSMGFKGGRVLEPTVGIGNFIGRMPADMAASSQWHASELDTVTGQMAALLYPEASVLAATGFQDAPFADGAFDLAIGNPPFGAQTIEDKNPRRAHLSGMKIHNYIIAKTGMHLRPGGVMSMVVTHRFLDTANPEARDSLAGDFRFLGAFRLPNDAFKSNAGTDVVTDVIFLKKLRPHEGRSRSASWLDVNGSITVDGATMRVNRYYEKNPSHILGRSAMDGSMYGGRRNADGTGEYTVHGDGRDIGAAIDALIEGDFGSMTSMALVKTSEDMGLAPAMLAQSDLPVGGILLGDDGKIMRRELDDGAGNAVVSEITPDTLWKDQAAQWLALRDIILDIKVAAEKRGMASAEDVEDLISLSRFAYKSDGKPKSSPSKAEEAVYKLVDDLAVPGAFKWAHGAEMAQIAATLSRKQLGKDGHQSLKGMLDLRNRTLRLINAEMTGSPDMETYRADLNDAYDAFVKNNGYLSDNKNSGLLDGDIGSEAGLEASFTPAVSAAVAKSTGVPVRKASAKKADILTQRVNFPYKEITSANNAPDALFASLSEHGKVDLPYMAKITGLSVREVIDELTSGDNPQLFMDPELQEYQEAERYLSGNVKHKLKIANERGMKANIKALQAAQPAPKVKDQVKPNIRGMWMPASIFEQFLQALGYRTPQITILTSQGMLSAQADSFNSTDLGIQFRNPDRTPIDMFNAAAAGKPIIIMRRDGDKTYKDEPATKAVNALIERMSKVFTEWAYSDEDRVRRIVDAFNENMNTHTPRTYDGTKYLKPVGANPSITMRRTQKDASWRMMQEKTILLDHVVGAGKTFTLITGIMERRRMGLSRKPMVVVPNHLVTQWARDFYKLYPGAKILAASPADFAKKNRRRLLARIATGDYDAIIVGHTSIGFMENPESDLRAIIDEKLAGLREAMEEARTNDESKRTLGQIQDRIARYEERLEQLADRPADDIGIDFKALGVDYLAVDESHEFKNLEYSTSGERVIGMNDPAGSKKAFDLYVKVRGLQARGGGVAFATGTPVSNSLVEIYTLMSYLAHDELVLRQQEHFDSWSGAYAATETRLEYTATQKLKPRRVLAGLNNLSALRQLYEQFADIINMADLKRLYTEEMGVKNLRDGTDLRTDFPVPKVANGGRVLSSGDITPAQREYMDYLVARMGAIEANKADKEYMRIDNALNVLTDARKMSLDIRIVDPSMPRDEGGKVVRAAKSIKATYDKWSDDRGTQLVFCDLSTPAKTALKDARRMVGELAEKLFSKEQVKQVRKQLEGFSLQDQWKRLAERAEEIIDNPATTEEKRDGLTAYLEKIEDPEATMMTADIGFSVYDDLKKVLIESGIPESEIAFIHDFNTPEQKEKLFDRVNEGYVRVLIGSSAKMGAGTNAQRRLVALHHMDAPWRPSDVEQREGRIIRQGNMLYERDPDGFEVEIHAYSTNNTSDTVMWQILERKAGAIEQFRADGLDNVEEEGGDSDQYAEFMASSTGNPVFRLKLEAELRLTEIEAEIGGALITRGNARDFLGRYEQDTERDSSKLEALASVDLAAASFGGESGTAEEFTQAMKKANDEYLNKYAAYATKKAAADLALAAWEVELEMSRGDKPSMPSAPSQPGIFTKQILKESGWARAMTLALTEVRVNKQMTISLPGRAKLVVDGSERGGSNSWNIMLVVGDKSFSIERSGADLAASSSNLAQALTPDRLLNGVTFMQRNLQEDVKRRDQRKDTEERRAMIEVDTRPRDTARHEMEWFALQVGFAEEQADIERSGRPNRFIVRDKRRKLGSSASVEAKPITQYTVYGETYETTGLQTRLWGSRLDDARRVRDGFPVILKIGQDSNGTATGVVEQVIPQPASIEFKPRRPPSAPITLKSPPPLKFERMPLLAFSRNDARAPGMPTAQVQSIADRIAAGWTNAPEIVVVTGMADPRTPQAARDDDQRQRAKGAGGAAGFAHDGMVYLLADQLSSPSHAAEVLLHESVGYIGLQGAFGKGLTQVLNQVVLTRRSEVMAKAEQYRLDTNSPADMLTAAEEVLAELAQSRPELGFVRRAIAAVRNWLRTNIPMPEGMVLTDDMIVTQFILPARRFVEGGGPGPKGGQPAPAFLRGEDVRFSRSPATGPRATLGAYTRAATDRLNEVFSHPGKLSLWDKTVGSQYHLAQRSVPFKRVFTAAQNFINDVSFYANEAANMAPKILPRMESWRDLAKSPVSAADNKAIAAPILEGTLSWARDESGRPVRIEDLQATYDRLDDEAKAQMLLRKRLVTAGQLQRWRGSPLDIYSGAVRNRFDAAFLAPGVVWTNAELQSMFNLIGEQLAGGTWSGQIGLYREFRAATDKSLDNLVKADLLRFGGKDVEPVRDMVMEASDADEAAVLLRDYLLSLAGADPERASGLTDSANGMIDRADKVAKLKKRGYAPLSRFGRYKVYVEVNGESQYFGLFESIQDSNKMAVQLAEEFGADSVTQGTMSQLEFEQLQGITPESLELFGNMLGLDSTGSEAQDQAFQAYLKLTKTNRSAMKRMIHRQGTAGFSEEMGRVLAAFVYSNARQTSAALHMGELGEAVNDIDKGGARSGMGELKDHAMRLSTYIKQPKEEAQALRGMLFAQYLGGSVASALVNFTQPLTVTFPYLSQFGGAAKSGAALMQAMNDMRNGTVLDEALAKALHQAEEDGVVSPQAVHELQAQAQGRAALRSGDGTRKGDAIAAAQNGLSKLALAWGKLFGLAEQINRRSTFIAAYRVAVDHLPVLQQKLADATGAERANVQRQIAELASPEEFAYKAVRDTQFISNKANKSRFARGPIGATLMTFKSYSTNYLELLHRMGTQGGPEGKKAMGLMLFMLFLMAGASGMPGSDDLDDLADFFAQRLGYNWSSKKAKQDFLENMVGKTFAGFVENGITGLPGSPIDVSGRMSMANLLPGTGLLLKKRDHTGDLKELFGPAGDLVQRGFSAADQALSGDIGQAMLTVAPKAVGNWAKGADMASTGNYNDDKGAKVIATTPFEAAMKFAGFQPASVVKVQEANYIHQRAKDFYSLKSQEISARWAKGIYEKDPNQVTKARAMVASWNANNPDQPMRVNMAAIVQRVRQMRKSKDQRIADTAPRALRGQMKRDVAEMQAEMR